LQNSEPDNPLGYLLEAEARWWEMYCEASTVKWGMVDAWQRPKLPADNDYLALTEKAIRIAHAQLAKRDSAEMHFYAGMGLALQARLYALLYEKRATARAGVAARKEFLQTLQLDPSFADADTGLGLYNYYVDTLSSFVKVLRFLMGIPGGNRQEGIRQLERGMNEGQITSVGARFYLAKNLRTYEHDYQRALEIAQPLVTRYPGNPSFQLLVGNLHEELGHTSEATAAFRAAANLQGMGPACQARTRKLAAEGWACCSMK
jgi:tetratricopeptide (TPR) repeat protein